MIELKDVTKVYPDPRGGEVVAVRDLSLEVPTGETLCLIGTSGCGKTTTMKMVNRLIDATSGQILLDGTPVGDQDPIALRRRIGYVIQRGGLFPHMTVAENIGLLCKLEGWAPAKTRGRVDELLALVNMDPGEFRDRYPRELSGGQRQRVGVARALALDPDYMLMDEPFGALDRPTRWEMQDLLVELWHEVEATVFLVTHDIAEGVYLGDRVFLLAPSPGRLIETVEVGVPTGDASHAQQSSQFRKVVHHVGRRLSEVTHGR